MNARLILRMTAPVVATSLLLLGLGIGAAWYVHDSQRKVSRAVRVNVQAMRAAEEVEIAVREIRSRLDNYLITEDREHLAEIRKQEREIDNWLPEARRLALTEYEQELMAQFQRGYAAYRKALKEIGLLEKTEVPRPQVRRLIEEILVQEMLKPVHDYLDFNEKEVEDALAQHQDFAGLLVYGLLLLGTCGSGAGLVAGFGFARGFSQKLIQLSVPIRAAAGQLDAVVGPITFEGGDLHQMEDALRTIADRIGAVVARLRQSEREALQAEQLAALGQMAAGMAHELRNPLTSMKMLIQGAQGGDPWNSEAVGLSDRDLRILEEEIERLERLTQEFLDFARPPQPEKQVMDVVPLIEQTVRLVAGRAGTEQAQFRFTPPRATGPLCAAVDPGQFRQVLMNLLLNALDAVRQRCPPLPPQERQIVVNVEAAQGGLDVKVSDNGCGLPAHLGAQIFVPFTTTKETGLGLGLSISKRIAEAHGGTITATNRPEGGAEFTFHLPATGMK
jgi:signal transduction histidine kinase/CHASE3 domain sensor protein